MTKQNSSADYVEQLEELAEERDVIIKELQSENSAVNKKLQEWSDCMQTVDQIIAMEKPNDFKDSAASEKLAFLMMSRARIMDELDAERKQSQQELAECHMHIQTLQEYFEKERGNHEEDVRCLKGNLKKLREQSEKSHEDEILVLIEESEQLQEILQLEQKKNRQLESELKKKLDHPPSQDISGPSRCNLPDHKALQSEIVKLSQSLEEAQEFRMNSDAVGAENRSKELAKRLEDCRADLEIEQGRSERLKKSLSHNDGEALLKSDEENLRLRTKLRAANEKTRELETKLHQMEQELWNKQAEHRKNLASTRMELARANDALAQEFKKRTESDSLLNVQNKENDATIKEIERILGKKNINLQAIGHELLGCLKDRDFLEANLQKERNKSFELDGLTRKLQTDLESMENRYTGADTARLKLEGQFDTMKKTLLDKEHQLKQERDKRAGLYVGSEEKLQQAYRDLQELRMETQRVNSLLKEKEISLQNLREEITKQKDEHEKAIKLLHGKYQSLGGSQQGEVSILSSQLELIKNERAEVISKCEELERNNRFLQEENTNLSDQASGFDDQLEILQTQLSKITISKANLHTELHQAWQEYQESESKRVTLETTIQRLQTELKRKSSTAEENENALTERTAIQKGFILEADKRAENAERKVVELKCGLDQQAFHLKACKDEISQLRNVQKLVAKRNEENSSLKGTIDSLNKKLVQLQSKCQVFENRIDKLSQLKSSSSDLSVELPRQLLDVNKSFEELREKKSTDYQHNSDTMKSILEYENRRLKENLNDMTRNFEELSLKFENRKSKTKEKLQLAREILSEEKRKLELEIEKVQAELTQTKLKVGEERVMKSKLEEANRDLRRENNYLKSQISPTRVDKENYPYELQKKNLPESKSLHGAIHNGYSSKVMQHQQLSDQILESPNFTSTPCFQGDCRHDC